MVIGTYHQPAPQRKRAKRGGKQRNSVELGASGYLARESSMPREVKTSWFSSHATPTVISWRKGPAQVTRQVYTLRYQGELWLWDPYLR